MNGRRAGSSDPASGAPASLALIARPIVLPRVRKWAGAFRGYLLVVLGAGLTRTLSLLTAVLLARELGASSFGQVSVFLAFLIFWVGSDFLDATFVRYANAPSGDQPDDYLRAIFVLKIALNATLLAVSLPLAHFLANTVFSKPSLSTPIFAAFVCWIGLNFLSLHAATHQARERFLHYSAANASFHVLAFIAILVALGLSSSRSPFSVYVAYTAVAILVGVYSFVAVKRTVRHLRFDKRLVKKAVSFSKWLFAAHVTYVAFQQLDVLLLTAFVSLADVGEYSAGLRVVGIVALLTGTLAPALLPRATRAAEAPVLLRAYLKQSAVLAGAIAALACAVWLAAPAIVVTLFGSEYQDAAEFTRVLLVGTALVGIYTPLAQLLLAYNEPRRIFHASALKLAVIAGTGLVLVPRLGGVGAALAVTLSDVAALAYVLVALRPRIAAALVPRHAATT